MLDLKRWWNKTRPKNQSLKSSNEIFNMVLRRGSYTDELEKWAKERHYKLDGVYPSNQKPKRKSFKYMIHNLDEKGMRGSHWIAVYHDGKFGDIYFDPLGDPPEEHINKTYNIELWNENATQINSENNNLCGLHCLYFLNHIQ